MKNEKTVEIPVFCDILVLNFQFKEENEMFCKNCGAEFEGTFCPACGTTVAVTPVEAPYVAPEMTVPAEDPGAKNGQTSVILGIVSLVTGTICNCIPYASCLTNPISLVTAILALAMGGKAYKLSAEAGYENGKAKTGKLLGIISLVLYVIGAILGIIFVILYFLGLAAIPMLDY